MEFRGRMHPGAAVCLRADPWISAEKDAAGISLPFRTRRRGKTSLSLPHISSIVVLIYLFVVDLTTFSIFHIIERRMMQCIVNNELETMRK